MCVNCWSGITASTTRFRKGMRRAMKETKAIRRARALALRRRYSLGKDGTVMRNDFSVEDYNNLRTFGDVSSVSDKKGEGGSNLYGLPL